MTKVRKAVPAAKAPAKRAKVAKQDKVPEVAIEIEVASEPAKPVMTLVADNNEDGLAIPEFLRRDKNEPKPDLKLILSDKREWVMPDPDRPKEKPAALPLYVDNREAPVTVVYYRPKKLVRTSHKGEPMAPDKKEKLAEYENMNAFEAAHDHKTYPVNTALTKCNKNFTMIFVNPKPWAKMEPVPGIADGEPTPPTARQERKAKVARSFAQPDAAGKAVAANSSLAAILRLLLAGKHTLAQIVKESGVEGGVVSAEDKVIHRIRFILFRQHGIGHTVTPDGIMSAVLPSGFDATSIFKVAKG